MKKMDWKSIGKNVNEMMPDRQFVVHGSYTINVIGNKKNGAFGRIKTVSIKV
jgi:endonuclease IV